jgi:hypothetical protein
MLVALASSTLFFGFGSPSATRSFDGGYGGGAPDTYAVPPMEMPAAAPVQPDLAFDSTGNYLYEESVKSSTVPESERLVIQNVDMAVVVADPKTRMSEIADMAVEMGGYVVSANLYQSTYGPNNVPVPEGNITVRVPSDQLDEALDFIKEDVVEVTYENRSGQDVTNEYVDLQSRLKAKQAAELKLLEILNEAEETEDVLAVYAQLQQIQSEIEVLKGQIKYYEESAALSAISVRLIAEETVQPIEIGGWELKGTANEAVQDLILFTQDFTQSLIRLFLYVLPALVLLAIPAYLIFLGGRAVYRRIKKSSNGGDKMTVADYLEQDDSKKEK